MHCLKILYDVWDPATNEEPDEYGGAAVLRQAERHVFVALEDHRGEAGSGGTIDFLWSTKAWRVRWELERS